MQRKPLAQYRALRALAEGAAGTLDLLADVSGLSLSRLRKLAEREGWKLHGSPQEDLAERVRAMVSVALARFEAMCRTIESGGRIDKAELDAIAAIMRGLEKIGDMVMRPEEAARQEQIRRDEDLAAVLEHINDRIVELARDLAGQILA